MGVIMHVLIPVFFNAPLGGLQSHVYAQAKAIAKEGWNCTILCKAGPFAQQCQNGGFDVIEDDFSNPPASASRITESNKFDIIHTHPFASRQIGQRIAKTLNIPLTITIHGKYTDSLENNSEDYNRIYCVSLGIRDHLVKKGVKDPHKILIYPNAVDLDIFHDGPSERSDRVNAIRNHFSQQTDSNDRIIAFACRMGSDKKFILKCITDAWEDQLKNRLDNWQWLIAGDGPERQDLEMAANKLNETIGRQCIKFLGWQSEEKLNILYQSVDIAVAPGRSALDCFGCSRPVIAIGSNGYIGLVDEDNWYKGSYSNFGGVGEKDYVTGQLYTDIHSVIYDDARLATIGQFGKNKISNSYDQKHWDKWLVNEYREIVDRHKSLHCQHGRLG